MAGGPWRWLRRPAQDERPRGCGRPGRVL